MRKNISIIIQFIAFAMFLVGIFSFVVCILKGNEAGRGYFTRDATSQAMWYAGIVPSIATFFSSFIVYGFSYIVEAACKYLERCESDNH